MKYGRCSGLLLPAALLVASTTAANAYIGPGSGLSAIGSLVSVVAAMVLAIVGFVWYPLKRLFRRRAPRAQRPAAADEAGRASAKE